MNLDKNQLIRDIYAAATDPSGWTRVFASFQQAFSGHTALYERRHSNPATHQLLATDLDPDFVRLYNGRYNALNVWATSPLNQAGGMVISERIITRSELERTEFYGDWLRPQRLQHAVTCPLIRQENRSINLGLVREQRRGEYGREELRLLGDLVAHLRRSVEIATRVEAIGLAQNVSLDALNATGACLMVIDSDGDICFASTEAELLIAERTVLTTRGRKLAAVDPAEHKKLELNIQAATTDAPMACGGLLSLDRRGLAPRHSVAVTPIAGERVGLFREQRLCLVMVARPRMASAPSVHALGAMFDLTPAEARLAQAICNGEAIGGYAAAWGVSVTTVKTHLRALFGKMGVNRQTDLVRLVLTDPILSRIAD